MYGLETVTEKEKGGWVEDGHIFIGSEQNGQYQTCVHQRDSSGLETKLEVRLRLFGHVQREDGGFTWQKTLTESCQAGEKEEDLMTMDVVKNDTQRIVVKKEHAGSFMWLPKKMNTAYIGAVFKKIKHLLIQMGLKTQCENMSLWSVHFVSMHAMIWVTG